MKKNVENAFEQMRPETRMRYVRELYNIWNPTRSVYPRTTDPKRPQQKVRNATLKTLTNMKLIEEIKIADKWFVITPEGKEVLDTYYSEACEWFPLMASWEPKPV